MKNSKHLPTAILVTVLSINLFFGFRAYSESTSKNKKDRVESVRVLVDAVSILRKNYVDADKVSYEKLVYAAMEGMVKELDKHSRFHTPSDNEDVKEDTAGKFAGIGVILNFKDKTLSVKKLIPGGPASKGDLKAGDIIIEVDGYVLKGEGFSEAKEHIKGERGTKVVLKVLRTVDGEEQEVTVPLVRDIVKVPSVTRVRVIPETNFGYFYVKQFSRDSGKEFQAALNTLVEKGINGLVLDLRGNPGGMLDAAVEMCSVFLDKSELVIYTQGRDSRGRRDYLALGGKKYKNLPIVILIDSGSASASEILSACLHDYGKAILIGEKSYGKGSVQTIVDLRDGSAIRFTIAKYFTKSNQTIHEVGISPDIPVKLTKEEKKDVYEHLGDLYPFEEELHDFDKDDRQLQTAIGVLKNVVNSDLSQQVLKTFKQRREEILKEVEKYTSAIPAEKSKESPSENK